MSSSRHLGNKYIWQRLKNDGSKWKRFTFSPQIQEKHSTAEIVNNRGNLLERIGTTSWLLARLGKGKDIAKKALLPEGYPNSVHPHYLSFTSWNFIHMIMSSAIGVLSTQSLLYGLGLGSSTSTMALSATLNWILKDGLGQLGGIAIVAYLGSRFDAEAKRFRFLAAVALKIACLIELTVPLIPGSFVLVASAANILKNFSWMATSATRAQIHRHLTKMDNMGDLSAKTASQNTTASLIGTGLGLALSSLFMKSSIIGSFALFIPLCLGSLYSCYQSCRFAVSPHLSLHRIGMICQSLFPEILLADGRFNHEVVAQLKRYIQRPDTIAKREPIFWRESRGNICIEPSISNFDPRVFLTDEIKKKYWIIVNKEGVVNIWFPEQVTTESDLFDGIFISYLILHYLKHGITFNLQTVEKEYDDYLRRDLHLALHSRGWILNDIHLGSRAPLRIK